MNTGHDFNFNGGKKLSKIAAWWFVSYAYFNTIDKTHMAWNSGITENSLNSRKSKYNNSTSYHKEWLQEVLKMEHLDKHRNTGKLSGIQIKDMAKKILDKIK